MEPQPIPMDQLEKEWVEYWHTNQNRNIKEAYDAFWDARGGRDIYTFDKK